MMRVICRLKFLTIIVLTFFVLSSKGQIYQQMPQYGYTGPRFNMDSTLSIPTVCGVPTLKSNLIKKAAIAFDSCNNKFYQYNPKTFVWSEISGGGTVAKAVDSVYKINNGDTIYIRYTNDITLKIKDSIGGGSSIDTTGAFVNNIVKVNDSTLRFYKGTSNSDLILSNGRFKNDIYIKGATTTRLGKYTGTGTSDSTRIPVAGLDLDAAFKIMVQDTVHPGYTRPTAGMSSNISEGIYDIGRTLTITFNYINNASTKVNDAGNIYDSALRLNNSFIPSNTPYSLNLNNTSAKIFDGFVYFRKTPTSKLKVNNFGVLDSFYAIKVDTAVKAAQTYTYTGSYRRYWGYTTQYNPVADSVKKTLGGGNEFATTNVKSSFNINCPNELRYIYYAYPTTFTPDIASIKINGNESINTFHKNIITINNGYIDISFAVWTSNNQVSGTIPNIVITQ